MPTATGFGAMLARAVFPADRRYDDDVRAVCLRIEMVVDALAPLRMPADEEGA